MDFLCISLSCFSLLSMIPDHRCSLSFLICSCSLVTFYFTHKFYSNTQNPLNSQSLTSCLSQNAEKEAAALIDAYGSYLDLYECLKFAGILRSKLLIDKLVNVAKHDSHHKEAVKTLQRAKVLLFYEPVGLCPCFCWLP